MFRLSDTQAIEVSVSATRTLQGTASYIDLPRQSGMSIFSSLGETFPFALSAPSTDVTAVPQPIVPGTVRNCDLLNIYNADASTAQVTVKFSNNGSDSTLKRADLNPGQTLFWSPQAGYGVL